MQEVRSGHALGFLFFAKPAIQNPNIQPGVFLAKMKDERSFAFLFTVILCTFRLFSLVGSKSLRNEVFHSILSVMFSHAQLLLGLD